MILSILKSLSLGVWLGSLLMLGAAVAAPIFQELPSKTLAGHLNGIILSRMNLIEWVCGTLAFISSVVLLAMNWNGEFRTLRIIETALVFVMISILWIYSTRITGRMNDLRQTIGDFDHPQETTEYVQAKAEFDDLHKAYTKLVGINMILITSTFVLSIVNTRPG
ncbi:MAG TPA: DUF4149 domain-containing protein [Candidatus Kapabacteria bacterium]|nr:DUF4149 domain-containing protein [Candidatus Kapabacteria bacterium]